jgi:hypothetical protein
MPSTHRLVSNNKTVNKGCAAHGGQDSGIAFKVKPGTGSNRAQSPGNAEILSFLRGWQRLQTGVWPGAMVGVTMVGVTMVGVTTVEDRAWAVLNRQSMKH